MANSTGPKFYAVRYGREGPKIYNTWEEVCVVAHRRNNISTLIEAISLYNKTKENVSLEIGMFLVSYVLNRDVKDISLFRCSAQELSVSRISTGVAPGSWSNL